jgi:hypothetical protein
MSGSIPLRHDQVPANAAKLPAMHSGAHIPKGGKQNDGDIGDDGGEALADDPGGMKNGQPEQPGAW